MTKPDAKRTGGKGVALVCDWLTGMRGGERCLEVLCELYPDADIFTLVHYPGSVSETIESHRIHTSFIQKLPGDSVSFRRYLPLFPAAIERFDLRGYDAVVSLSHCVAKGVRAEPGTEHVCYCHTPVRYAWHMREEYLRGLGSLKRFASRPVLNSLRAWDLRTAGRVDRYIANSRNVQGRIREAYGREAEVIYPPVACERFEVSHADEGFFLVLSALVPYKRVDLVVEVFSRVHRDKKLLVAGSGPELERLKAMAGGNVEFVQNATDEQVAGFLRKCRALLFPGEEDFGIVPLEAQACGKCVIAYGAGGALETVLQGERPDVSTGVFFREQTPEALARAIDAFEEKRGDYDPAFCRANALKFDVRMYREKMRGIIEAALAKRAGR